MKLSDFHSFKRKLNELYVNVKDSSMYKQLFNNINALDCLETYCLGISYQIVSHSTLSREHQIKLLDDFYEEAHIPFDPSEVYTMMENGPYTIEENPVWYGIDAMTSNRPGSVNFCLYYSLMTGMISKQEGINYYNELTKLLSSFLHSFGHHTDVYVDEYIAETEHYTTTMAAQFVENCQKEYMQASKKVN